jgi:hypothetical protein
MIEQSHEETLERHIEALLAIIIHVTGRMMISTSNGILGWHVPG